MFSVSYPFFRPFGNLSCFSLVSSVSIAAPIDQLSEAESHGQKKAKVNRLNKNKRFLGPWEDKLHATKMECSVKRNSRHDSNSKSYPDHVSKKKKQAKVEVDEKLDKRERSASPSKGHTKATVSSAGPILKKNECLILDVLNMGTIIFNYDYYIPCRRAIRKSNRQP